MRNEKLFLSIFIIIFFIIVTPLNIFAQSSYVLPYPSYMPGNKLYKVDVLFEMLEKYWYFGTFSQFEYNLKLSDKYLVESKTLFEYHQYVLAISALEKSDYYMSNIPQILNQAKIEGKDISEKKELLINAISKHQEVLEDLIKSTPENYVWLEEKSNPVNLAIHEKIRQSINVRNKVL